MEGGKRAKCAAHSHKQTGFDADADLLVKVGNFPYARGLDIVVLGGEYSRGKVEWFLLHVSRGALIGALSPGSQTLSP